MSTDLDHSTEVVRRDDGWWLWRCDCGDHGTAWGYADAGQRARDHVDGATA